MDDILPFFAHFGLEAVGVFFVLSGFVIGYVTHAKEKTLKIHAINRAARVYSVVIPCLALTFFFDTIGRHFDVSYYDPLGSRSHEDTWRIPHSFLPGSDGPFWTLCYEVPYYAAYGAAYFLRGPWRRLLSIAILAAAGPVSFTLYLFHLPFATLLGGLLPRATPNSLRLAILIFTTLALTLIVAHLSERKNTSGGQRSNA